MLETYERAAREAGFALDDPQRAAADRLARPGAEIDRTLSRPQTPRRRLTVREVPALIRGRRAALAQLGRGHPTMCQPASRKPERRSHSAMLSVSEWEVGPADFPLLPRWWASRLATASP
ncbi:hypothetical protein SAMN05216371_6119 [Streptomyces sp. TLI_053]|nr:hypothetical protein SAMN05216371_6119 [Streptomyces sp. TLI_053]